MRRVCRGLLRRPGRAFGLALRGETPELDRSGVLVLLRRLEAESAQDGGEVGGRAADLRSKVWRDGEGGCFGCAAELREKTGETLCEVGADGAWAKAEIAGGVQHRVGPGVIFQRE
jgi:hypothetical protein